MIKPILKYGDRQLTFMHLTKIHNYDTLVNEHYFKTHKRLSPDFVEEWEDEDEKTFVIMFHKPDNPLSLNYMKELGLLQYFSNPDFDIEFSKISLVFAQKDKMLREIWCFIGSVPELIIINIYKNNRLVFQEEQSMQDGDIKVLAVRSEVRHVPIFAMSLDILRKNKEHFSRRDSFYQDERYSTTHPIVKYTQLVLGNYYVTVDNEKELLHFGDALKRDMDTLNYIIKDITPFGVVEIAYNKELREIVNIDVLRTSGNYTDEEVRAIYKTVEVDEYNLKLLFAVRDEKNNREGIVVKDTNGENINCEFYNFYVE